MHVHEAGEALFAGVFVIDDLDDTACFCRFAQEGLVCLIGVNRRGEGQQECGACSRQIVLCIDLLREVCPTLRGQRALVA